MEKCKLERLKISITNVCNLGCKHCYLIEDDYVFLSFETIKSILDDAHLNGIKIIDITGGEPTTHPNFCDIILYAYELGFKINLSTNGLNLYKDSILKLLMSTNVECHISLDAVTEKKLSRIRGDGVFTQLDLVLKKLKEYHINFSLRFSLNKLNYMDVSDMINYATNMGVNVSFGATQLVGHADQSLILDNSNFIFVKEQITKKRKETSIKIEECFTNYCPCDGAFMEILSINHFGNPVICLMLSTEEIRKCISRKFESLYAMLNEAYKSKMKLKEFALTEKCESCEYNFLCSSGCLVTAKTMGCI